MLKNYLLSALRNFWRFRGYTALNLLGLAIGTTASLLIIQYVLHELSYDQFHAQKDDIYRVQYDFLREGELVFQSASSFPAVGPSMEADFPEVESSARMYLFYGGTVVRIGEKAYQENGVYVVDTSFLTMFDYPWVRGDRSRALSNPGTVVISTDVAQKYFGQEDPIGKRITIGNRGDYEVTGVMESPEQSHIAFSILISISSTYQWWDNIRETLKSNWSWYDFYNYVKLTPGADVAALEAKLPAFIDKYTSEGVSERIRFQLQPLTDIHLYSDLIQEHRPNGNGTTTYTLLGISFFILLIAWINYVNLATARALGRAREVGVRKAIGAKRHQLMGQFLLETALLNVLAVSIAVVLYELSRGYFQRLLGHELALTLVGQSIFWWMLAGFLTIGTFLAGLYPAFVLSGYRPVHVLKGTLLKGQQGQWLRKGLVTFQFIASVALISGTIIVYQQLRYMVNQDLGMNINQTLVLNGPDVLQVDSTYLSDYAAFKQSVMRVPGVQSLAASSEIPGNLIYWTNGARGEGQPQEANGILYQMGIDEDFIPSYEMRLLAGRNMGPSYGLEENSLVINQTAMRIFGFPSPDTAIGRGVIFGNDTMRVVGVIEDYHQQSLKKAHNPIALSYRPDMRNYYSIKLDVSNLDQSLPEIEATFQRFFPGNPVVYRFLDDFFNQQYQSERRFGAVFTLFAGLAIAVACLGLVGLSMFTAAQRRKEVSIRKVLGSSIHGIFLLLSREFFYLVVIANLLAIPLVWWAMQRWLADFAFRIQLSWWMFALSAVITVFIAMATVTWQAMRAAQTNPADVLRGE